MEWHMTLQVKMEDPKLHNQQLTSHRFKIQGFKIQDWLELHQFHTTIIGFELKYLIYYPKFVIEVKTCLSMWSDLPCCAVTKVIGQCYFNSVPDPFNGQTADFTLKPPKVIESTTVCLQSGEAAEAPLIIHIVKIFIKDIMKGFWI